MYSASMHLQITLLMYTNWKSLLEGGSSSIARQDTIFIRTRDLQRYRA